MAHSAPQSKSGNARGSLPGALPSVGAHVPLHQHYVPNYKGKSKSRAVSHNMEFLSRVFASEGASRFFKTFLLRFIFDANKSTSDDYSAFMIASLA